MRSLILKSAIAAAHESEADAVEKAYYKGQKMSARQKRLARMGDARWAQQSSQSDADRATTQRIIAGSLRRQKSGGSLNVGPGPTAMASKKALVEWRHRMRSLGHSADSGVDAGSITRTRMRALRSNMSGI